MGDRGEDIEQMTTGRTRTRVAAFRTEPIWYVFYLVSHQGSPGTMFWLKKTMATGNTISFLHFRL